MRIRPARIVAANLAGSGVRGMVVWVLAGNPSRSFYEALGGQHVSVKPVTIGGVRLEEVAYGWPDIRALLA